MNTVAVPTGDLLYVCSNMPFPIRRYYCIIFWNRVSLFIILSEPRVAKLCFFSLEQGQVPRHSVTHLHPKLRGYPLTYWQSVNCQPTTVNQHYCRLTSTDCWFQGDKVHMIRIIQAFSKIKLVGYHQWHVLIGWATSRLSGDSLRVRVNQ